MSDVDVLVVGAGPSGLTLAAEVARRGASVQIVEKRALAPVSRAGTVLPRPMELLDARGIADRFLARGYELNGVGTLSSTHVWAGMSPLAWSPLGSRFGFTLYLPQHETEVLLRAWAEEVGVQIRFESALVDLTETSDEIRATTLNADGVEEDTTAQYVVCADGGRGKSRELLGIDWVGHDTTFTGIVATARMEFAWPGGVRPGQNKYGFTVAFPFGTGLTRFAIVHVESAKRPVEEPITAAEVSHAASEILEEKIEVTELVEGTRYGDAMKVAGQMRKGRAFLVGESVRIHYPASGVGMNFCIQDAFNLGWKLAAVVQGDANPALLDTYESERRPIVDDLLESVRAQVAVQYNFSEGGAAYRRRFEKDLIQLPSVNAELVRELNGLQTPYERPPDAHPAVGLPAPDFEILRFDGSPVRLYELLRDHPFVVLDLSGAESVEATEVKDLPAALVAGYPVRLPAALAGASVIVVRPDTYLAWVYDAVPEPGAIRQQLTRSLYLD
ncbi:FAD-dependent monooxygenase [Mycolicibacterium stellerae]|uniref:FAD-dependent monooxygenase n=1 Tax=Mycolicibacterium stellerae TaxID=2358193 RepID=UPI000F0B7DD2|nr:FAD-dependent monooxygenase [Mycolicibacterium stellerae]